LTLYLGVNGLGISQGFQFIGVNMKRIDKTSLFEQFQGADLERLADCFVAIRKAGLITSPYTQAGLNESSGNVWVWDEDWAGCIACSIGFDVFWVYSCPECGEEHEFKTYFELEEYANQFDSQCESCAKVTA
jgi:hypothetical protein